MKLMSGFALLVIGSLAQAKTIAGMYPTEVITFAKGTNVLTDETKKELQTLVSAARERSKIDKVYIAAWADRVRTSTDTDLTDAEQDLAAKRAENVSEFLKASMDVSVDTFNMAKSATTLGGIFKTTDAKVKGKVPAKENVIAKIIRTNGTASSVVVVVERDSSARTGE